MIFLNKNNTTNTNILLHEYFRPLIIFLNTNNSNNTNVLFT